MISVTNAFGIDMGQVEDALKTGASIVGKLASLNFVGAAYGLVDEAN